MALPDFALAAAVRQSRPQLLMRELWRPRACAQLAASLKELNALFYPAQDYGSAHHQLELNGGVWVVVF